MTTHILFAALAAVVASRGATPGPKRSRKSSCRSDSHVTKQQYRRATVYKEHRRRPAMVGSKDQVAQPEFPAIWLAVDSNVRQ
jgi:hypothetical protein